MSPFLEIGNYVVLGVMMLFVLFITWILANGRDYDGGPEK